ncbi:hypothetical protein B0H14DRAFT_2681930 [Mycena olivaceomarginata]|nr:hypothetical protein B0H14DRAFT_2681930 [Mycena olivaceomarginata]
MSSLVAFVIGSGQNIGDSTAAALKAQGYKVAVGSRKPAVEERQRDGYLPVAMDAHSPEGVKAAFAHVNAELGPPSVVVFNTGLSVTAPVPEDPLSLPLEAFQRQTAVASAVYAAAQEALVGFRSDTLKGMNKTFIITGNPLPWLPADVLPIYFGLNIQKLILWRLMEFFSGAYLKEQARFYFATLVGEKGGVIEDVSAFPTSGPQHAQVYLDLITRADQTNWDYRFTLDGKQWAN